MDEGNSELVLTAECTCSNDGVRADKFLTELFPQINRSQIKKAIQSGDVTINDCVIKKKQQFVEGDFVKITLPAEKESRPFAVNIPLDVVYEDNDIVVINKKAGMVTHPGNGTQADTLVHALLSHCSGKLSVLNGEDRPGIVHRLDKDTSGVIIAAKTDDALTSLLEDFKNRDVQKQYLALVAGTPDLKSGTINAPIGRHPTNRTRMGVVEDGKEAITDWQVVESKENVTLIKCHIHTGRTHQIRVHLSHLGFPIIGDRLYGYQPNRHSKVKLKPGRPLLHANQLKISHPVSKEQLEFKADPPKDFQQWLDVIKADHK